MQDKLWELRIKYKSLSPRALAPLLGQIRLNLSELPLVI